MEKNYNGYYSSYLYNSELGENNDIYYLKVRDNKIVDAAHISWDDGGVWSYPTVSDNACKYSLEAIGENFKDFMLDQFMTNTEGCEGTSLKMIDEKAFEYRKSYMLKELGISQQEYNQKVADILQAKENKATLGKTGVMDKIATMKSGHEGGK